VELILINDGLFQLVSVTKEMMKNVTLLDKIDCFELCDILRIYLTTYHEPPFNVHVMNDGTGNLMGCLCR